MVRQLLRAAIDIVLGQINKIRFPDAACRSGARGLRLGQRDRDAGLFAGQDFLTFDFLTFKVTPIRSDVSLRSAAFAACAIASRRTNSRSTAVFRVVICGNCLLEGFVVFGILKGRDHGLEGQCVTNWV